MHTSRVIFLNSALVESLQSYLAEDATPQVLSLVCAAAAAHDGAVNHPDLKEFFLSFVAEAWESGRIRRPVSWEIYSEKISLFNMNFQHFNFVCGAVASHEHASLYPGVGKDAFLELIETAWDGGDLHRRAQLCEIEGNILSEEGVAINLACHILLFGERKGFLVKE